MKRDVCGKSIVIYTKEKKSLENCADDVLPMVHEIETTSTPDAETLHGLVDLVTFRLHKSDYALDMFMKFKDGYLAVNLPKNCFIKNLKEEGFTLVAVRKN